MINISSVSSAVPFPEIYSRYIMGLQHGYPLHDPEPDLSLPPAARKKGVRIGDVGLVTRDGSFDFLFNVCDQYREINPSRLPDSFEVIDSVDISKTTEFP